MECSVNDVVRYSSAGACKVVAVEEQKTARGREKYYVLQPLFTSGSKVYVPLANAALVDRIRPLPEPGEIRAMLRDLPDAGEWIDDKQRRLTVFADILGRGEPGELLLMLQTLYAREVALHRLGKRLRQSDERVLRGAKKALYGIIAYVLQIDLSQVPSLVRDAFESNSSKKDKIASEG